jgi:hypothetical protein
VGVVILRFAPTVRVFPGLQEDAELGRLVSESKAPLTCKDWARIGEQLGKTSKQCRERWSNVLDPSLVNLRNKWTQEELDLLFEAQRVIGSRWSRIAELYFKGRYGHCWCGNGCLLAITAFRLMGVLSPVMLSHCFRA